MVQQEVKKKTRVYGTVAILSALVLVSLIYVFGSAPGFAPNSQNGNPTANLTVSAMKTFASYDELKNYLNTNSKGASTYAGGPLDSRYFGGDSKAVPPMPTPAPAVPSMTAESGGQSNQRTLHHEHSSCRRRRSRHHQERRHIHLHSIQRLFNWAKLRLHRQSRPERPTRNRQDSLGQ